MFRGDIGQLFGIGIVIVKFGGTVAPSREAPAGSADALGVEFRVAGDEGEGGVLDIGGLVTNAVVGSRFGLSMAWAVVIGVVEICVFARMPGRGRP